MYSINRVLISKFDFNELTMYQWIIYAMARQGHAVLLGLVDFTPRRGYIVLTLYMYATYIMPPFVKIQDSLLLEVVLNVQERKTVVSAVLSSEHVCVSCLQLNDKFLNDFKQAI